MSIKNVAIIGANGNLGPSVLEQLNQAGTFEVTVLNRASSKSTYPSSVKVTTIDDDLNASSLTKALGGQDALVVTMAGSRVDEQIKLANACLAAGVQRFIPADFGSCDSDDEYTLELLPLFKGKAKVRAHLQELARQSGNKFAWTSLVTAHLFDWGLRGNLLQIDVKGKSAKLVDGGDVKWSATDMPYIGLAVVKILQHPNDNKNEILYIQSFCTSQNEVVRILEEETKSKFKTTKISSADMIAANKDKAHQGDHDAIEEVVSVHGLVAANWGKTRSLANEKLELPPADLRDSIRTVLSTMS